MNLPRYRAFVSYAHDDREQFLTLVKALEEECNVSILSDRNIGAGTPFTDAIKGLITHAHLFVPLITGNAQKKPWVHQETGFAMARNIPVLPIVCDDAGLPSEMIAQLQAIKVKNDLSDLAEQLRDTSIRNLIFPRPAPPNEMVVVAEWPEQRAKLLADYADRVRELGGSGIFRQRGALSSFCIPDVDIYDEAWDKREGAAPRSPYYRYLQREERRALEWHAGREGCRLILDPFVRFNDLEKTIARWETVHKFLKGAEGFPVEVVFSEQAPDGNVTMLGEWFVAESMVPGPGGYRQTVFNWHAPTVSRWVERFDAQFDGLCREQGLEASKSRAPAIERISQIVCEYKQAKGSSEKPESERS